MDLEDAMTRVSREPRMVNIHEEFVQVGEVIDIPAETAVVFEYFIPDDGYKYHLASFMWALWVSQESASLPGPLLCHGAFSLTRNPEDWNLITMGYVYGFTEHEPTKLGALALRYPCVYGAYVDNTSAQGIIAGAAIFMYRKYVEG